MADIGLPGAFQTSLFGVPQKSTMVNFFAEKSIIPNTANRGATITYFTSFNYLYKCPAASSGIRNTQVLWF